MMSEIKTKHFTLIIYGILSSIIIGLGTFCWDLNGRISSVESGKAEREVLRQEHAEDKNALWRKYSDMADEISSLTKEVFRNTMARELWIREHEKWGNE
ncbi:MAG: hypothetical protein ACW980_25565 [Promethearchaeota archaeon]|jgi:hypothetical protein